MLSFSLLILSVTFLPKIFIHSNKIKQGELKNQKKEKKEDGWYTSKSIKNDADIMLLISQHFNNVSVTESDTVFRVASKERELHKPVVTGGQ